LEVASVGRSLGNIISNKLIKAGEVPKNDISNEIGSIVSSACLAHDLGNPPFGHSGEEAIAKFFRSGNGSQYREKLSDAEWNDLTMFDGNANAFRVLSNRFKGRRPGGFALTYSTLASIVKYPYESVLAGKKPKFGFFQSEKNTYNSIAKELGLVKLSDNPVSYVRHPLVYLVEAADDICYQIIDVEDSHKLKILSYEKTEKLFRNFFNSETDGDTQKLIDSNFETVTDKNERIAYLRAMTISRLVYECADIFWNNREKIMHGEFNGSLFGRLEGNSAEAMKYIMDISVEKIYNDRSVVEIEIAGYKILGTLLDEFTTAIMNPEIALSQKVLSLIPLQYRNNEETTFGKIQSIVDFVSGMTDLYALDLYRKIKGISLPGT
jgi:dGTPase